MTKAEELYHQIADGIPGTIQSKMFGALCIKAENGKAGVMFWKDYMVFKLDKDEEQKALTLKDAKVFEPGGRPMNGWVQLSYDHASKWKNYAEIAMEHVRKIAVDKPKVAKKTRK